jgi:hypothetical protein
MYSQHNNNIIIIKRKISRIRSWIWNSKRSAMSMFLNNGINEVDHETGSIKSCRAELASPGEHQNSRQRSPMGYSGNWKSMSLQMGVLDIWIPGEIPESLTAVEVVRSTWLGTCPDKL